MQITNRIDNAAFKANVFVRGVSSQRTSVAAAKLAVEQGFITEKNIQHVIRVNDGHLVLDRKTLAAKILTKIDEIKEEMFIGSWQEGVATEKYDEALTEIITNRHTRKIN